MTMRVAVAISGRGSNLDALLAALPDRSPGRSGAGAEQPGRGRRSSWRGSAACRALVLRRTRRTAGEWLDALEPRTGWT